MNVFIQVLGKELTQHINNGIYLVKSQSHVHSKHTPPVLSGYLMTVDRIYFWLYLHHFSLISVPFILLTSPKANQMPARTGRLHAFRFLTNTRETRKVTIFSGNDHHYPLCTTGWAVPLYACWMNLVYQSVIRSCCVSQQWLYPCCVNQHASAHNKDGPRPVWHSFGPEDGAVTCPLQPRLYLCCQFSLYAHRAAVEWAEVRKSERKYTHTMRSLHSKQLDKA